jgi:hypothetical protein
MTGLSSAKRGEASAMPQDGAKWKKRAPVLRKLPFVGVFQQSFPQILLKAEWRWEGM